MLLNLPSLMSVVCVRSLLLLPVCYRRHLCDEPAPGTEQKDDLNNLRTTSILRNLMSAVCVTSLLRPLVCPADIFAVNQHPGAEQKDDLNNLRTAIDLSQATLVVLDSAGTPLERVWWVMGGRVRVGWEGGGQLVILVVLDSAGTPLQRVWWVMGGKEVRVGIVGQNSLPERVTVGTVEKAGGTGLSKPTPWGVWGKLIPDGRKAVV